MEAKLRYEQNKIIVIQYGLFVRCSVTNEIIYPEDIRYWNVERQEVYASAKISLDRELEIRGYSGK